MADSQNNKPQRIAYEYIKLDENGKRDFNDLILHPDKLPPEPADQWQPFTMGEVYKPLQPIRYLAHELLEVGSLNILYGPPGTLKSFLMQDLAACVVTGKTWLQPAPWGTGEGRSITTTQAAAVWDTARTNANSAVVGSFSNWRLVNMYEGTNLQKAGYSRAFSWSPFNQAATNDRYWTSTRGKY